MAYHVQRSDVPGAFRSMDFRRASWLVSSVRFLVVLGVLAATLVVLASAFAGEPSSAIAKRDATATDSDEQERARAELERARRNTAIDVASLDRLMAAADEFPAGVVRLEAWMFGAETYARLGRSDLAVPLWRRVGRGEDPVLRAAAATALVRHWIARGELDAAREDAGEHAQLIRMVSVARMRSRVRFAALAVIAATFVLGSVAMVRATRSRSKVSVFAIVAFAAYVAAGGVLATRYEHGTARPFLLLAIVLVPILLLARAWGAAGSRDWRARAMRAALCAASALGAAFVVLEQTDATYLEGLGL
jgi:hypothetical protein